MQLEFHPHAHLDANEALTYYLARSQRAAEGFVRELDRALDSIAKNPQHFGRFTEDDFRACTVTRYPYQVVFRIEGDILYVIAIAHVSRRPEYWRNRT